MSIIFSTRFRLGSASVCALLSLASAGNGIAAIPLGTAHGFGVLGASTVTNTGPTSVTGNVGAGGLTSAVVGFPPGVSTGTIHAADAAAMQAQLDLTAALLVPKKP